MSGSRVEKYKKYRSNIAQSTDSMPVLNNPAEDEKFASEAGFFKKIRLKRRIQNSLVVLLIVAIITLLVVFGIKLF